MGNIVSIENLQKFIEQDLKEDLKIRYLFSLSNNIEQLSTQAVCQVFQKLFFNTFSDSCGIFTI
jgi:hypothetical protein